MADGELDHIVSDSGSRRRSPLWVLAAALAAIVLVGGVLAVLGDDDDGAVVDAAALLTSAPDTMREAGSARMSMQMSFDGGGMEMTISGEGIVDFVTGAGTFVMEILGQSIEMRTDGTTMWMQLPDFGQGAPAGGWFAVPAADFQSSGQLGTNIDSAAGLLDALRGIGGEIEEVGHGEIDGLEVTQYRVVVDLEEAIAAAPEAQRARAEASLSQLGELGATEMPIDVWITDGGLPVRQVMRWAPDGVEGIPLGFEMEVRVDFSDFGTAVVVEPPPADQVQTIDADELQQLLGGTPPVAA